MYTSRYPMTLSHVMQGPEMLLGERQGIVPHALLEPSSECPPVAFICWLSFIHSLHAFQSADQVRCSRHSMAALQPALSWDSLHYVIESSLLALVHVEQFLLLAGHECCSREMRQSDWRCGSPTPLHLLLVLLA